MHMYRGNKTVTNSSSYCFGKVVTIIFIIVFFEVMPLKSIFSVPIKPEEEHMFGVPGLGGYSILIQNKTKMRNSVARERES